MRIVDEFVELETRLDTAITFTVVQYLPRIASQHMSNLELIAVGVAVCGAHVAWSRGSPGSSAPLARTMLLLAGLLL